MLLRRRDEEEDSHLPTPERRIPLRKHNGEKDTQLLTLGKDSICQKIWKTCFGQHGTLPASTRLDKLLTAWEYASLN